MAITAMNQAEAHRRRLLIAGAAGLGDTESIMAAHADAPVPAESMDASSAGSPYPGAEAVSPSASTDISMD